MPRDPSTGGLISSIVAAALCVKPRGMLTESQKAKVAVLKSSLPSFAVMRALAMRFRGMMKSGKADGLDAWLRDAVGSGIYGMQVFARGLRKDLAAVRNERVDDEMVEWPSRRTDQPAQDSEANDVWPRQCRNNACQTTSVATFLSARKSRQNPLNVSVRAALQRSCRNLAGRRTSGSPRSDGHYQSEPGHPTCPRRP
jgi:hypothetical protein